MTSTLTRRIAASSMMLALVLFATAASAQNYTASSITNNFGANDISTTGTVLVGGASTDDGEEVVNFPGGFTFDFYGVTQTSVTVNSNGWIYFGSQTLSTVQMRTPPTAAPDAAIPNGYIAGCYDDLNPASASSDAVYVERLSTPDRFVVQYNNIVTFGSTTNFAQFSIVLYATGTIEIHYSTGQTHVATPVAVGVENIAGTLATPGPFGLATLPTPTDAFRWDVPLNPTVSLTTGSVFTGNASAGFDASIDTGVALANFSLDCDDPNDPNINATITTSAGAPGVTQPANVSSGAVPFNLVWTGSATTPGTYTYNVVLDDGSLQTNFDVRITVTDPSPAIQQPIPPTAGSPILITEFTTNTGSDTFEIQNIGATAFDATGWTVIISDSYTVISTANAITIGLGSFAAGQTQVFDDAGSGTQYWGNNIFWDPTGKGWIMLVDAAGVIRDFVMFNWAATDIVGMSVNAGGYTGLNPSAVWSGNGVTDNGNVFARIGTQDNDDLTDWQDNGATNSFGATNGGLTLPFSTTAGATIGGADPNWTGTLIVGADLTITFVAQDSSSSQTLTYTVTVTGGSLTPAAAGFTQTFTGGVYNDPSPGQSPHSLTLTGTAAAVGTVTFDVSVSDGALTDVVSYALTIDPPPPSEINLKNAGGTSIPTGTTDTIAASIPVGFAQNFTYTIENLAAGTLDLNGTLPVNLTNTSNCGVSITQPTAAQVAGNSSITFTVAITASSAAGWTADFSIPNNDSDENPYDFTIAGTAYDPTPEIDLQRPVGTSIANNGTDTVTGTFNAVPTTLTYTIANQDLGDLILSGTPAVVIGGLSNCSASINSGPSTPVGANASTTFIVDLTPNGATTWSFTVSIANNDSNENPYQFTVTGTAGPTPAPEMDLQRPAGAGNSIAVGGTDTVTGSLATVITSLSYTVANTGNATLNLTGTPRVAIVGTPVNCNASYNSNAPTSVPAASSAVFGIDITPAAAGNWSVNISIDNDDANENPYTWTISGSAGPAPAPEIDLQRPAGTSIAVATSDVVSGTVAATPTMLTYTILNTGNATLNVSTPTISAQNNCTATVGTPPTATVSPASSTTFTITVTPGAAGAWSFSVSMVNDDPNENPYAWTVSGNAQSSPAPEIDVQRPAGTSIASGGTDSHVNFTGTQTVTYTITNTGSLPLSLTGMTPVTLSGALNCTPSVLLQPAGTVAVGSSTTFQVQVVAPATGNFGFTITIANDDPDENPYIVQFSGTPTSGGGGTGGGGGGGGGGGCASGTGTAPWLLLGIVALMGVVGITRRRLA
ncbi:MAG: choice-of-anchor D domain-containing protein [Planctomycetes bacterium]|nr:choice-of-anchor D domain-containing protein [Planctomycetota bacterium]